MTGTFKIVNYKTEFVLKAGRFISSYDLMINGFTALQQFSRKRRNSKSYAIDICIDEDLQKRDEFTEMDILNGKPFFFK